LWPGLNISFLFTYPPNLSASLFIGNLDDQIQLPLNSAADVGQTSSQEQITTFLYTTFSADLAVHAQFECSLCLIVGRYYYNTDFHL